eukprot:EG_transcript_22597
MHMRRRPRLWPWAAAAVAVGLVLGCQLIAEAVGGVRSTGNWQVEPLQWRSTLNGNRLHPVSTNQPLGAVSAVAPYALAPPPLGQSLAALLHHARVVLVSALPRGVAGQAACGVIAVVAAVSWLLSCRGRTKLAPPTTTAPYDRLATEVTALQAHRRALAGTVDALAAELGALRATVRPLAVTLRDVAGGCVRQAVRRRYGDAYAEPCALWSLAEALALVPSPPGPRGSAVPSDAVGGLGLLQDTCAALLRPELLDAFLADFFRLVGHYAPQALPAAGPPA